MLRLFVFSVLLFSVVSAGRFRFERTEKRDIRGSVAGRFGFTQPVDHFGPNILNWTQYGVLNTSYYRAGGPIFLVLGGEGPMRPDCASGRYIVNTYAPSFNAAIACIEHRFYGQSQPFPSLATRNLQYLTSKQALADFKAVAAWLKGSLAAGQVVTFGGSYAGSLSTWMRLRYPDTISMALASSAPVLAQVEFPEYFEVVAKSLRTMGTASCPATLASAISLFRRLSPSQLGALFGTCAPLNSDLNMVTFWEYFADTFSGFVQYNNDNRPGFPFNVKELCRRLESGPATQTFPAFFKFWNNFSGTNCTDSDYIADLNQLMNEDPTASSAASRAWYWQTCNEFGYYQTGKSSQQPFPSLINLPYFLNMCQNVFGISGGKVIRNVDATNNFYGGLNPNTTRVIFTNGEIDPWHVLSVLESSPSRELLAIVMKTTAHCADLYPPSPADPIELTIVRTNVEVVLSVWLDDNNKA